MKILALSGSLRRISYNTAAIVALKKLAGKEVEITIGSIANLPLFDSDREEENIPPLKNLKNLLKESSGLIISSPEYAHGISGPLKNALDWLVSGSEFPEIPIMLINTSPRASHGQVALREVLTTMSGKVIEKASVSIPLLGSGLNSTGVLENEEISQRLLDGANIFFKEIEKIEYENN